MRELFQEILQLIVTYFIINKQKYYLFMKIFEFLTLKCIQFYKK